MLSKILIVLLVLSAGFAVSGVTAVVSAYMNTTKTDDLQVNLSEEAEPREVRLVVGTTDNPPESTETEVEQEHLEAIETSKVSSVRSQPKIPAVLKVSDVEVLEVAEQIESEISSEEKEVSDNLKKAPTQGTNKVFTVPFYSQFADITPANWKKVSCGIAGVAMLIDFYSDRAVSADKLLQQGISAGAFLSDAGWTHQGLINLTKEYGLNGRSHSFAGSSMEVAFNKLKAVLEEGPVMASVHYTFQPTNPIPHLVVVNGVKDGKVFYNDPAEESGGGSISIAQFQSAWKKRYIEIRPEF